jgi:hypothetical protein
MSTATTPEPYQGSQHLVLNLPAIVSPHCAAPPVANRRRHIGWLLAVTLFVFVASRGRPVIHHDVYHQMALMRESLRIGTIPRAELFAYTATINPAVQHEWGAGLIALLATRMGGATGILVLHYAVVGLMFLALLWVWRIQRASLSAIIPPLILGAPLALYGVVPVVAQTYSLLGFSLLLGLIARDRVRPGARIWVLLPISLVWVNVHAGFVIGIAALGAECVERMIHRQQWVHLATVAIAICGIVSCNPYGLAYYSYLLHALTMPRPGITGWNPRWLISDFGAVNLLFIASLFVLAYAVKCAGWRRARGFLILLFLALLSVRSSRIVPFYALAWLALVPALLTRSRIASALDRVIDTEPMTMRIALGTALAVSLLLAVYRQAWHLAVPAEAGGGETLYYPVGAVEYLKRTGFTGNLMTHFNNGAYVLWHLYPRVRVGCDSRHETAYTDAWVLENHRMYTEEQGDFWKVVLRTYPTDVVLVSRVFPLARKLDRQKEWRRVYVDNGFALYARPGVDLPQRSRAGEHIEGVFP